MFTVNSTLNEWMTCNCCYAMLPKESLCNFVSDHTEIFLLKYLSISCCSYRILWSFVYPIVLCLSKHIKGLYYLKKFWAIQTLWCGSLIFLYSFLLVKILYDLKDRGKNCQKYFSFQLIALRGEEKDGGKKDRSNLGMECSDWLRSLCQTFHKLFIWVQNFLSEEEN